MKLKMIFLATAITYFPHASAVDSSVVKGAFGFMLSGDHGVENAGIKNFKVDGCKTSYEQNLLGIKIKVKNDFSKANYKSASYKRENGKLMFNLSGGAGLQEMTATDKEGKDASNMLMLYGLMPGVSQTTSFPVLTIKKRFEGALSDLRSECPGKTSKY